MLALAKRSSRWHDRSMVQATDRDTSEETPEERAERQRLASEAIREADRKLKAKKLPRKEWLKRVRKHRASIRTNISTEDILSAIDSGRK